MFAAFDTLQAASPLRGCKKKAKRAAHRRQSTHMGKGSAPGDESFVACWCLGAESRGVHRAVRYRLVDVQVPVADLEIIPAGRIRRRPILSYGDPRFSKEPFGRHPLPLANHLCRS
jgi:hypothetical protein